VSAPAILQKICDRGSPLTSIMDMDPHSASSSRQAELRTERLCLRAFSIMDVPRLALLAGKRRVADTTISVPHPYSTENAQGAVLHFIEEQLSGSGYHFAIALSQSPAEFFGYFALRDIDQEHLAGELSFWIDETASGHGYVTEAGHAILTFAFGDLGLNRVCAYHMVRNTASANVLRRLGLQQEGILRQRVRKWGIFEDVCLSAILREDSLRS
jgi:[ribosomal protein S5]-alanine N-acetyltransferase